MVGAAGCRSEEPCNHTCAVQRVQHLHWALQAAERNQRDDLDGLLGQLLPTLIWSRRHSWRSQVWPGEMLLAAFPTTWLLMRLLPCLTRLAGSALWARFQAPTIARLRRASKNKATARQRIRAMQRRAAWLAFLLDPSRLLQAHAWCSLLWGPLFTWRVPLSCLLLPALADLARLVLGPYGWCPAMFLASSNASLDLWPCALLLLQAGAVLCFWALPKRWASLPCTLAVWAFLCRLPMRLPWALFKLAAPWLIPCPIQRRLMVTEYWLGVLRA